MSWNMFLCMASCCEKLFVIFLVFTFGFMLSEKKKSFKPTKPIKLTAKNHTAICRKTDPKWYALVLIMKKPIPISLVINLEKNRANRTMHTYAFSNPSITKKVNLIKI